MPAVAGDAGSRRLLPAAQPLELGPRLGVDPVAQARRLLLDVRRALELREEGARGDLATSWPDVPRTARSEETRQTRSPWRCSAARRSSSVSASGA